MKYRSIRPPDGAPMLRPMKRQEDGISGLGIALTVIINARWLNIERDWDDHRDDTCARSNPRSRCLFFAPWLARVRQSGGARRSNGARACDRTKMADQGADARSDRGLPILAGTARRPSRHLCLIPAYRILGSVGWRRGL